MTSPPTSRRERKKAVTHQTIANAALRLFLAHGFDAVGVREVAEAADVSTTTLFKHFPSKESLVFDEGEAREKAMLAAIEGRPPGESAVQALLHHYLTSWKQRALDPQLTAFEALVHSSPALEDYARRLNLQLETALAEGIAASSGRATGDVASRALAHFMLEAPALARHSPNPELALRHIFALLEEGWQSTIG